MAHSSDTMEQHDCVICASALGTNGGTLTLLCGDSAHCTCTAICNTCAHMRSVWSMSSPHANRLVLCLPHRPPFLCRLHLPLAPAQLALPCVPSHGQPRAKRQLGCSPFPTSSLHNACRVRGTPRGSSCSISGGRAMEDCLG